MGMAASQARYLALTARKTNTEYEGQQINQARTALANQSANLFNQLLDLEVPVAPKTTDYTELQYSYSDGENESVIESWHQLSSADPNYNYIVNHYYYADIFTGSQKLLENPQIRTRNEVVGDKINDRTPAPTINYATDANGNVTSVEILGNNGTIGYTGPFVPVSTKQIDNKLENALADLEADKIIERQNGILNTNEILATQDTNGTWHFILQTDANNYDPIDYVSTYELSHVGNCKLTELTNLTDEQTKAELAQILRDCKDTNMSKYLEFNQDGELVYINNKGIYSFEMNNVTYYTNETDLLNSIQTQYHTEKPIENQEKLAYYNASYIRTKIEETNQALLETDGNGRFKSVKFDDDSIVYALNTETVTDEDAYQDAMNEYNYKVQQYEKTIADINAKTSIIQKEDRTLELRLKQLDTEQNALATELDAVKKVIKDNVEKTFKTFSD